ncbi:hypothetical protein HID58_048100 [Brassica napus]|uniref:Uncharacterized protein n=1 Tax=Brassica napus TaxID=3708 RepID=A0ABQ8B159_BRANA|nr:hypothetical protein HID58_048100 [Brassica napus]
MFFLCSHHRWRASHVPPPESIDVPCFQFTSDPFHGEREQKEKVRRECCVSEPSITDLHCHEPLVTGDLHHVTGDQDASIVAMSEKVKCIISCFL